MITCQTEPATFGCLYPDSLCDNCKARVTLAELLLFTKAVCERLPEDEARDALNVWHEYRLAAVHMKVIV